jgi:methionyl-tRNA formyltransferase
VVGEIINRTVQIGTVVIEPQSFTKEIIDFTHFIDANLVSIEEVDQVLELENTGDIGISCGFSLIFTRKVIDHFPSGILNIHTGDLPNYRSRHPISWAMINGESQIGITIHKVDEKIDCGYLVHKFYVDRSFSDDLSSLQVKIESALFNEFPESIKKLSNKDLEKLSSGVYWQRINKVFNNVDPRKIPAKQLYSLFMSQKIYGGVNILGHKKIECHIYYDIFEHHYEGYEIHKCKDGVLVALK